MRTVALIIICVLVLVFVYRSYIEESFANKDEKARAIVDWFHKTPSHSYATYRSHTGGDSNIVEYEDARRLFAEKNLTVPAIARIL
jgi:hypothetical protein